MLWQIKFKQINWFGGFFTTTFFGSTEKRVGKKADVCVMVGARVILPSCRSAAVKGGGGGKKRKAHLSSAQVPNLVISSIGKNPTLEGAYCKDSWAVFGFL